MYNDTAIQICMSGLVDFKNGSQYEQEFILAKSIEMATEKGMICPSCGIVMLNNSVAIMHKDGTIMGKYEACICLSCGNVYPAHEIEKQLALKEAALVLMDDLLELMEGDELCQEKTATPENGHTRITE